MQLTVMMPTKIEAAAIWIKVPVRFGTEDIPDDFPLRKGDVWEAVIGLDDGRVRDWPAGREGRVAMKVVDGGAYELLDRDGRRLAVVDGDYVPKCVPGDFGDYVDIRIGPDGVMRDWGRWFREDVVKESFWAVIG